MRNNTIKSLILSALALATLTLSATADPQTPPSSATSAPEAPVNAVVETLQVHERPQQPLVVSEDVEKAQRESSERPRGESRTVRDTQSRQSEKPLLEVHGF